MSNAAFWLIMTLLCLSIHAFYSMMEMACVSFSKVRLQYYVGQNRSRASWIHHLIRRPSRLFGTTLLGVNVALQIGSECSRLFYQSLDLSPNLAPISQVILVLIFAELVPMFAARRYSEHVALLGIPFLYASYNILRPIIFLVDLFSKGISYLVYGKVTQEPGTLTRDELQKVLEEGQDSHDHTFTNSDVYNKIKCFTYGEIFDRIVIHSQNLEVIICLQ